MRLAIGGRRGELGRVLSTNAPTHGFTLPATGPVDAFIDVTDQGPNSLLHDGHAWKGYVDGALRHTQRRLQEARARDAGVYVHAGFAFLRGIDDAQKVPSPLREVVDTALAVEELVLAAPMTTRVVRLGYLYGPWMKDLRAYRTAFRLGRPYWSGPARTRHDHVHQRDGAEALLAAATPPKSGRLHYASDEHPLAFRELMDDFARLVGNPLPLHLGGAFRLTAWVIIRREHMQAVKVGVPATPPRPPVPGWKPAYPDYREGLAQVMSEWARR